MPGSAITDHIGSLGRRPNSTTINAALLPESTSDRFYYCHQYIVMYRYIFKILFFVPTKTTHPDPGRANLRSNFFCEVFFGTMMILRGSLLTQGVTSSSRAWSPELAVRP